MAAPPQITVRNLSGKYVMNKTLSNPSDPLLAIQGMGWLTRKAIGMATVTLHLNQTKTDADQIHIIQTVTGGIRGTVEHRSLDWSERAHEDHVFGKVKGRSRYFSPLSFLDKEICARTPQGEIDPTDLKFLKGEVLIDSTPAGFLPAGEYIQSFVENTENNWTAEQIWGFEEIEGKRYYTRRVIVRRTDNGEVQRARLVYTYEGECELKE